MEKLKQHDIVMIGEDHRVRCHPQFISEIIKAIHTERNEVSLDWLALEFGNYGDQSLADEFIDASEYRKDLVIKILQNVPNNWGWPYQEYADIFKTVWEENKI